MSINKNSAYKQFIKGLILYLTIGMVVWSTLLIAFKLYFAIIGLFILSIVGWGITFIWSSAIADIELNEDDFNVITFFKIIKIKYNDFVIYDLARQYRPIMFIIYSNMKKIKVAYTNDNYINIRSLLSKGNSKYSLAQFENMINQFTVKPGFLD